MPRSSRPRQAELLMPAGSLAKLKTAILYGADAVYAGTPDLSLRTQSAFTLDELIEGVRFVHARGRRIYLTVNLFTHNRDVDKLAQFVATARDAGVDGLIVSDPGVFHYVRQNAPDLELHVSTQANVCSWLTVQSWAAQGADLCVLAREVSFVELAEIRQKCPDIKLEVFVHGAMCMTYSGRCLLSNFLAERGANQGNCAQSCRWNYKVIARRKARCKDGAEVEITPDNRDDFDFYIEEQYRPGELMPIEEDARGAYILNAKDLCLMGKLDDLLKVGVDSLKVEGRNKSEYYVGVTARAYRRAIDAWYRDPDAWTPEPYLEDIYSLQNRGYTLGFHDGRLGPLAHNFERTETVGGWLFAGVVERWDGHDLIFAPRNAMRAGDVIEFLPPDDKDVVRLRLYAFERADGSGRFEKASPGADRALRLPAALFHSEDTARIKEKLPVGTIARIKSDLSEDRRELLRANLVAMDIERGLGGDGGGSGAENARPALRGRTLQGKAPKLGLDGCCGLGCNGCLMFWNDEKYAKARKTLMGKKIGEKLNRISVPGD
ncbi:U32 family peptidase [Varunaivibrio sulfuroxidans]|uniref:Putative protease n=1 Tax=Varunaivibrio sulfuroxidans TaxID=1773489 RepID=A0A4R3J9J0_9PROT|nr:U32 family peptidase [Varunaivibrio sulfuroxidans]TCS62538.1 putative protease [Varunaivibrio sulfuroxidans]WES30792.1 U32 family peptidase [Varunaivibrio sulfuroxidans]